MSVSHEVHCDILKDYCHSHKGDHPSGWTLKYARDVAKIMGFKRIKGRDVCPNCLKKLDGDPS